jgi:glycosyltransferase involved in cell wall biosynthesis
MKAPITILLPVFNDSISLQQIVADIKSEQITISNDVQVIIVDDGSTEPLPKLENVKIIHLTRNLGHQKAIAIGLSYIKENHKDSTTIVMDCDGEDRVTDIQLLLNKNNGNNQQIVFAERKRRMNVAWFKLFYLLFKMSFYLFTGKKISFGNFSVIPYPALCKLVYYSEIWNNFPGGIMKSGLPYCAFPTERGRRYAGESKMNFTTLLLHGFGTIAVFLEIIITRIAIFSFLLMLVAAISIASIFFIKTFSTLAIPGWASYLGSSMFIILLISFIISLITIFIYLSTQSQRKFIPALHYKDYILHIETIGHG